MATIYATLIEDGAINPKTGEPWKVEDVNVIWPFPLRVSVGRPSPP